VSSEQIVERKYILFSTGQAFLAFIALFLAAMGALVLMAVLEMKVLVFVSLGLMLASIFVAFKIDSTFNRPGTAANRTGSTRTETSTSPPDDPPTAQM
jgi:hypothetical protein